MASDVRSDRRNGWRGRCRQCESEELGGPNLPVDRGFVLDGVVSSRESSRAKIVEIAICVGGARHIAGRWFGGIGNIGLSVDEKFGIRGKRPIILAVNDQIGKDAVRVDCAAWRPRQAINHRIWEFVQLEDGGIAAFACGEFKVDFVISAVHAGCIEGSVHIRIRRTKIRTRDVVFFVRTVGSVIVSLIIEDTDDGKGGTARALGGTETTAIHIETKAATHKFGRWAQAIHEWGRFGFRKQRIFVAFVGSVLDVEVIHTCGDLEIETIDGDLRGRYIFERDFLTVEVGFGALREAVACDGDAVVHDAALVTALRDVGDPQFGVGGHDRELEFVGLLSVLVIDVHIDGSGGFAGQVDTIFGDDLFVAAVDDIEFRCAKVECGCGEKIRALDAEEELFTDDGVGGCHLGQARGGRIEHDEFDGGAQGSARVDGLDVVFTGGEAREIDFAGYVVARRGAATYGRNGLSVEVHNRAELE